MNLLKSMFISAYMMFAMGLIFYAGWMVYEGEDPISWGGVLLTSGPLMMVIGSLMMFRNVARTSAHFPLLHILAMAGVGLSAWSWIYVGGDVLPFGLAMAGWIGFVLYAYWYSSFGARRPSVKIRPGSLLPAFAVQSVDGTAVTSAQLTADRPAILVFFRGNWCPLCMAEVKELVARYREIDALGVRVALISPQPHSHTRALARKFGVNFHFLTDNRGKAARNLGLNQKHGLPMGMQLMGYDSETVLPTVIITDRGGHVLWSHETDNYRIRPEPDVFLEVLHRCGAIPAAA